MNFPVDYLCMGGNSASHVVMHSSVGSSMGPFYSRSVPCALLAVVHVHLVFTLCRGTYMYMYIDHYKSRSCVFIGWCVLSCPVRRAQ